MLPPDGRKVEYGEMDEEQYSKQHKIGTKLQRQETDNSKRKNIGMTMLGRTMTLDLDI